MAMLAALIAICPKERLTCMHIEHGIRPAEESQGDADFVRAFCEEHSIENCIKHIPRGKIPVFARRKKTGIEAAARFFRHKALFKKAALLGENTVILLAHTKDDMLETALMRILRGAGPAGLVAMSRIAAIPCIATIPCVVTMPANRGQIARPLLDITRADVIEYLKAKKISWREDSSNYDEKFLRNKIRHQLVPLLDKSFPSWRTGVTGMADTQALAADFIGSEAKTRIKWQVSSEELGVRSEEYTTDNNTPHSTLLTTHSSSPPVRFVFTDFDNFFKQPLIIREEAVFQGINILSGSETLREVSVSKSIKRSVVRRFCKGVVNAADLGSVKIKQENGQIFVFKARKEFFERGVSRLIIE